MSLGMSGKDRFFDFFGRLSDAKVPEVPEDFNQFREQMSVEEQAKEFYEQLRKNSRFKGVPESFEQFSAILPRKQATDPVADSAGIPGTVESVKSEDTSRSRNYPGGLAGERAIELPEVKVFARKSGDVQGMNPERIQKTGFADTGIKAVAGVEEGKQEKTGGSAGYEPESVPMAGDRGIAPERLPKVGVKGLPGYIGQIGPDQVEGLVPGISGLSRKAEDLPGGELPGRMAGRGKLPEKERGLPEFVTGESDGRSGREKPGGEMHGYTGGQPDAEIPADEGSAGKTAEKTGLDALLEEKERLLEADGDLMKEWKEREKLDRMLAGAGGRLAVDDRFYTENRERYAKATGRYNELAQLIGTHPETKVRREAWRERLAERDKIEGEYRKTLKPAVEDYRYLPSNTGGTYIPVFSEDADEHRFLDQAKKLREDTLKLLEAPSRYEDSGAWKNWLRGNRDTFTDLDFWTLGIAEIGRNWDVKRVYDRALENKSGQRLEDFLKPGELALLSAHIDFLNAADERADDLSLGYEIGKGTPEVVTDILLSLLSGGVGKAASGVAKKALSQWMRKQVKGSLAKKLAKGLEHLTAEGARTAAATAVDPRTYRKIMREAVTPKRDAEGNMVLDEGGLPVFDSWTDVLPRSGRDALAENWANGVFDRVKPIVGKYVRKRSGAGEAYRAFMQAKPGELRGKAWGNLAKQVLQDELVAPYMESWYEKGIKALTGNPEELREFGTVEEQLKFFGTLLPALMLKGGVKAGGLLEAERRYGRSRDKVKVVLQEYGLSRQEAEMRLAELEGMSAGELADWAAPVIKQAGWTDPEKGKVLYQAFGNFNRDKTVYHLLAGSDAGLKEGNGGEVDRGGVREAGEEQPGRVDPVVSEDVGKLIPLVSGGPDAAVQDVPGVRVDKPGDVAGTDRGERLKTGQDSGERTEIPENGRMPGGTVAGDRADFRDKPGEAVRMLTELKKGKMEGVFHRKELGSVDLMWNSGKGDDGLARILDRLEETAGWDELAARMTEVIDRGKLVRNGKRRVTIQGEDFEADIRRGGDRRWELYDFRPVRKKGTAVPSGGKGKKKAAGKTAGSGKGITGEISDVRRGEGIKDGLSMVVPPVESGRMKPVDGVKSKLEAERFLNGLMKNGESFSWTGLLSRKSRPEA